MGTTATAMTGEHSILTTISLEPLGTVKHKKIHTHIKRSANDDDVDEDTDDNGNCSYYRHRLKMGRLEPRTTSCDRRTELETKSNDIRPGADPQTRAPGVGRTFPFALGNDRKFI